MACGTVMTLTTDNASALANVFNGTVWDDDANPGGQVPYANNNGVVGDQLFVNNTLASPEAPEEALGAFADENPNGVWTLTISDDNTGDVGTLDRWNLEITTYECSGTCVVTCNDNNECTDDTCDPATGCVYTPDPSNSCTDNNACTTDACVPNATGISCVSTPIACDDGNPCTDDSCDPASGCVYTPDPTNSCTDGNICTNDACSTTGQCVSTPVVCTDNNDCTDDSCDPTTGLHRVRDRREDPGTGAEPNDPSRGRDNRRF